MRVIDSPATDEGWRRPSPKLRNVRHLEVAVPGVIGLLVAAGVAIGSPLAGAIVAACVAAAAALCDWLLMRRVGAWGYREREDDLLVRRGVMVRRLSVVPYGRMQFVDVTAGPIERAFGLATVRLHTAAAATDARIPGLEVREASRLRDQLAHLGESRAAGL
jgi:membrane protein YdbS with pleckstrin-like domain